MSLQPTTARAPRRTARRFRAGGASLGIALGHALLFTGCAAERTLVFTTEPAGAQVRLDDDVVGVTPVEVPFLHYGTRRVTFNLEGFRTRSFLVEVKAPWYGRFPLDIVSEVLIPIGWEDRKTVHADLVPATGPVDLPTVRSVFDRAEALRRAGPNGPRDLPPVEVVPALPEAGDGAEANEDPDAATSAPDARRGER